MIELDLDRLKTLAAFLRSQLGLKQQPAGVVQLNDEEAEVAAEALEEYVFREHALGDVQKGEWDIVRGFYRRHHIPPKSMPKCLICAKEPAIYPPRITVKDLPRIIVCDVCRAKALTSDIAIRCDKDGHAMRVERVNPQGDPLSVIWQFWVRGPPKREEKLHERIDER